MNKVILNKKIADELMGLEGQCRGTSLKNDGEYVLLKEGAKGLKRLEGELERWGYPVNYQKVKSTEFYPLGLRAISLLAIKKVFGWGEEEIKDLCSFSVRTSLITRLYMRFFYSVPKMVKVAPRLWREFFSVGSLRVIEYDLEKKRAIVRIEDFKLHPLYCPCAGSLLAHVIKMLVGARRARFKEQKCAFKDEGEKGHEYRVEWQ